VGKFTVSRAWLRDLVWVRADCYSFDVDPQVSSLADFLVFSGNLGAKHLVVSLTDAQVPFGGHKESGIGMEFGMEGLKHYTNSRSLWVFKKVFE
jgi:hypothetical protein